MGRTRHGGAALRDWGLASAAVVSWAVFLQLVVVERPEGPDRGDAAEYVAMVEGSAAVSAPFAKRVGVPFVARHLRADPRAALAGLSRVAFVVFPVLLLVWLKRLGRGVRESALAVLLCCVNPAFAASAVNPWLVDTGYLVVQQLVLLALGFGASWLTLVLLGAGALVRENGAFLGFAPLVADLTARRRPAAFSVVAPLAGVVIALLLEWTRGGGVGALVFKPPGRLAGDLLGAWHGLWLFVVLGSRRAFVARHEWGAVLVVVLVPALLSSLVATDTSRLLFLGAPAVAACVALELPRLSPRGTWCVALALPFLAVGTLASVSTLASPPLLVVRQLALAAGAALLLVGRGLGLADERLDAVRSR